MAVSNTRPELLVIVGETASGKSDLAHKIAKRYNGEIIAADSWTVYRGFDIGASKPTKRDQSEVKYHLLDVAEAPEGFNAPKFKQLAEAAILDIKKRAKLPIMVGGTGLYIDSVLYDFSFLPHGGPNERAGLNAMTIPDLIERARQLGINLADIDTRNKRRIIRAIEAKGQKPTKRDQKTGSLIIGLHLSQEQRRLKIEQRIDQMLAAGLQKEVKNLADEYSWEAEPMKGIGYREWQAFFEGNQSLELTKQRIVSSTMNLAKKQRTWFKRNKAILWFNSPAEAYSFIAQRLNN